LQSTLRWKIEKEKIMIHPWFQKLKGNQREALLWIFVGQPGTGKSTMMQQFMGMNQRNLIVPSNIIEAPKTWGNLPYMKPTRTFYTDPSDPKKRRQKLKWNLQGCNTFQGTRLIDVSVFETNTDAYEFLPSILDPNNPNQGYNRGGFFLDDTKNYVISQGIMPHKIANILRARRHLGIDFFFAVHRFQDINSEFYGFGAKLFVFATNTPPSQNALEKISPQCQQQLMDSIAFVNQYSKSHDPHYFEPFDPTDPNANEWVRQHHRPK